MRMTKGEAIVKDWSMKASPEPSMIKGAKPGGAPETDVTALLEKVSDMDDLVVQFDGTEAGKRFIEA